MHYVAVLITDDDRSRRSDQQRQPIVHSMFVVFMLLVAGVSSQLIDATAITAAGDIANIRHSPQRLAGSTNANAIARTANIERTAWEFSDESVAHRRRLWRRDATGQPQDLCGMAGCGCSGKKLEMVQCNFTDPTFHKRSISLHHRHYIGGAVRSLEFRLGEHTSLDIQAGFFHRNAVQHLAVLAGAQFELTTDAMAGNTLARLQEIDVLGTGTVVFGSRAFHNELKLTVADARSVIVRSEAFNGTGFQVVFRRVQDLRMHEGAFARANSESHLVVEECGVDDVWPLQTSLRSVRFERSRIDRIRTKAFDVAELKAVEFRGCAIGVVEREVFTEKLFSLSVQFVDCTIDTIETEAIARSGINTLLFSDNRIERIEANAIRPAVALNTTVQNNTILVVRPMWLNLDGWQHVRVDRNRFGEYNRAVVAALANNPVECSFRHNLITDTGTEDSLYFEYGQCAVRNVTFAKQCKCGATWPRGLFRNGPRDGQMMQINCAADESVGECFNTTHMVWTEFVAAVCPRTAHFVECERRQQQTRMDIRGFAAIGPADDGGGWMRLSLRQIAIIVGGLVVLVLLLVAVAMVCGRIKRSLVGGGGGRDNVTCSAQILTRCDATALAAREANAFRTVDRRGSVPLMAMMKPSKSFSVDDRVIMRQTLHDMKGRYDGLLYDQVYNNTMKVLNDSLAEPEKVAAIGEIIEALQECQKVGGDFVAFTDILYKQLMPYGDGGSGGLNDPVYAELNRPEDEQRLARASIAGQMAGASAPNANNGDHIYAEPQNLQLPLLTSEYAWPLDRDAPAYSEYAEPHRNTALADASRHIISPYAIAATTNTTRPGPQQPSTSTAAAIGGTAFRRPPPPPYTLTAVAQPAPPVYSLPTAKTSTANGGARAKTSTGATPKPIPLQRSNGPSMSPAGRSTTTTTSTTADDDSNNHSDHSGGSDITCRLDELMYADAQALPSAPPRI